MLASFARAGNGGLARWSSSMVSISLLSLYRRHSSCLIKHCKGSFSLAYAQLENILNPSWTGRYQFIPLKYFCQHGQVTIRQAMSKRLKVTGTISCYSKIKNQKWNIGLERPSFTSILKLVHNPCNKTIKRSRQVITATFINFLR